MSEPMPEQPSNQIPYEPEPAPGPDKPAGPAALCRDRMGALWAWFKLAWAEGRSCEAEIGRTTHLFFLGCVGLVLVFLAWAAFFDLDIVSVAMGEVVPRSKVKRVQHLEGGIVREILVHEGDEVTQDQPLVVLDELQPGSSVEELQLRINALRVEIARLQAEDKGLPHPEFPADLVQTAPDLVHQAMNIFQTRTQRLQNDKDTQEETIRQRGQDIVEIESRLRSLNANLPLIRKQVERSKELYAEKLIKEDELIARQKELNTTVSLINESQAALERAHSMLTSANATLDQVSNTYHEEVRTQLRESQQEYLEAEQRLKKFTDIEQRTVIRSPVDGVVNTLYVQGQGEVVKPGMTIMDMVPKGDPLVIEAKLPIRDIGYVQVGQTALLRLPTSDARMFGTLEGKVTSISPDAVTQPTGETYYLARIETERDYFENNGNRYRLFPGMRLIAAIHTGERTVLQYLAYPYFDAFTHGLQER
ncbi:MAG: HlyD family type I secretion periplasmic adaptor subunit [Desulfovibrionaceae bacterium]